MLLNKKYFLYQTRSQIQNSGKQIELSGKWTRLNLGSLWSLADPASEEWFSLFIQIHFPSLYFHPFSWYLFTGVFPFPSLYFSKLMQFSKFMKRLLKSHLKQFRMLSSRPTAPYLPPTSSFPHSSSSKRVLKIKEASSQMPCFDQDIVNNWKCCHTAQKKGCGDVTQCQQCCIISGGYAEMTAAEQQWLRQSEIIHCVANIQLRIFGIFQSFLQHSAQSFEGKDWV